MAGGWIDSVDRLVDSSPRFVTALRAAFIRFQTPPPASSIPPASLLPALQFFLQRLSEDVDPRLAKILWRPVTEEDLNALDLSLQTRQPMEIDGFEKVARRLLKRLAVDRGKRLGLFVVGGIVAVHVVKGVVKRIPFVGPYINTFVTPFLPTPIAGPMAGIAGALYL